MTIFHLIITLLLLYYANGYQTGYTCDRSVKLSCPLQSKIIVLKVYYSPVCPQLNDVRSENDNWFPPSTCLGYKLDTIYSSCNGQENCYVELRQQIFSSENVQNRESNCQFSSKSINIEYSCVPDFMSSLLPRINICNGSTNVQGISEGFIFTPNYPGGYPNRQDCFKNIRASAGHRMKIFSIEFDVEGLSILRFLWVKKANDFLRINNGEKLYGSKNGIQLLFDDYIGATLQFVSDFANSKRPYTGFLLYFIITPDSPHTRSTTSTTTTTWSTLLELASSTTFNPFLGLLDEEEGEIQATTEQSILSEPKLPKDNDIFEMNDYPSVLSKISPLMSKKP
ncbi:unnamed protein product, partial [Didymodactylos carnosus]